jgi:hypothetical protein
MKTDKPSGQASYGLMKTNLKNYYMRLAPIDIMPGALSVIMIFLVVLRGGRSPSTAVLYILKYSLVFIAAVFVAPAADRIKNPIIQNPIIQFARNVYPLFPLAPVFQ